MTPEGKVRVLHTSDLHARYHRLEELLGTIEGLDLWIDTGDFFPNKTRGVRDVETTYQRRWATSWTNIAARIAKICIARGIKVLSVSGNHDYTSLVGLLRQAGMTEGTAYDLSSAERSVRLCGLQFAGFREIPWLEGEWNGEQHLGEFKNIVDRAMSHDPDVLLTHCPPDGILDAMGFKDAHEGIPYLTSYLMNHPHNARYHLFGHIHESGGKTIERGGILFSNAATEVSGNLLEFTLPPVVGGEPQSLIGTPERSSVSYYELDEQHREEMAADHLFTMEHDHVREIAKQRDEALAEVITLRSRVAELERQLSEKAR